MKYRTIVADPPWPANGAFDLRTRPWVIGAGGRRRRATVVPYSSQPLEWIDSLPVATLAEDDAHLYLWVPASLNRQGIGVRAAKAWGFSVVSEIVWDKIGYGLGAFPRPQHEIVLVCRRGKLSYVPRDVGSVQRWKSPRAHNNGGKIHSAKPDGFYDLVERASPGPYLELFARRQRLGWDTWGDECFQSVSLPQAAPATSSALSTHACTSTGTRPSQTNTNT